MGYFMAKSSFLAEVTFKFQCKEKLNENFDLYFTYFANLNLPKQKRKVKQTFSHLANHGLNV